MLLFLSVGYKIAIQDHLLFKGQKREDNLISINDRKSIDAGLKLGPV